MSEQSEQAEQLISSEQLEHRTVRTLKILKMSEQGEQTENLLFGLWWTLTSMLVTDVGDENFVTKCVGEMCWRRMCWRLNARQLLRMVKVMLVTT